MKTLFSVITLLIISFLFISCSSNSNPTLPSYTSPPASDSDTVPVAESEYDIRINPRGMFGAWQVQLNKENLTAEIIPARNAKAIGDVFDADLLQFLTVSPCSNCLMISGLRYGHDEYIQMDVTLKHPFDNATARPDLHGFDVRLIFIMDGLTGIDDSIKVTRPGGSEEPASYSNYMVLNPDGFTSHYDEIPNDERYFIKTADYAGNLNPYFRFFNDYQTDTFDPQSPSGHNVMPVGSNNYTRTAVLTSWEGFGTSFYLVADVAYGHSAVFSTRDDPKYYLPSYNRTEPWRTEYWIENNNLNYNDPNSSADVVVQVFDWQHNAVVDPNYPDPANLSGIRESSSVTQLELSLPYLQDDPIIVTIPESGTGTPTDPLQFRLNVKNTNLTSGKTTTGLLAVRDQLNGQASPSGRMPIPETPSGFPYNTLDILDYTHYRIIRVNIPETQYWDDDYNNELIVDPKTQYGQSWTRVEATFFMDPSHKQFQYRWDYDYDGITFDIDGSGLPSPYIEFTTPGRKNFALRIRTNSKPAREYIYEIPVYARGLSFERDIILPGSNNLMSSRGSHAVAVTDNYSYVVFAGKSYGPREIAIAQINLDGSFVRYWQITDSASVNYYDPAIVAVDDNGIDQIYLMFVGRDTSSDIYSLYGNFTDGFDNGNVKVVSDIPVINETSPCLIYRNNTLYGYYVVASISQNIWAVKSTDLAHNWTGHVKVDDGSTIQGSPAAAILPDEEYIYVVYEDYRNSATFGCDLYIAMDSDGDGLTFETIRNISTSREDIDDIRPSMVATENQLAIAYLQQPVGDDDNNMYLKTLDRSLISNNDFRASFCVNYNCNYTSPSISSAAKGQFTIGYGVFNQNTNDLKLLVYQFTEDEVGYFDLTTILNKVIGNVTPAQANAFAAVACRPVAGTSAVESFAAWRTYEYGIIPVTDPTQYFGEVDFLSFVSPGTD